MVESAFHLSITILILLFLSAVLAGFVDTLAGGGGMITTPALLLAGMPTSTALATNKLQACFGSLSASWFFIRRGKINLRALSIPLIAGLIGAALGAATVQILPTHWLQLGIPILLIAVALLFIYTPELGHIATTARISPLFFALFAALPVGFYDGFLGPGTGSFFLLALILGTGKDLQQATIDAKILNTTSNAGALTVFILTTKPVWIAGIIMAVGQFIGARVASHLILTKSIALIRPMVILMSIIMSAVLIHRFWI